jgi:DNA-binding NtrC family response regulator
MPDTQSATMNIKEVERLLIIATLQIMDGNRTRSAAALGISVRTIRNRLSEYRKLGFDIPESSSSSNMTSTTPTQSGTQ